jgi:hypothetical protein
MASSEDYEDLQIQWLEESRTTPDTTSASEAEGRARDALWPAADERRR